MRGKGGAVLDKKAGGRAKDGGGGQQTMLLKPLAAAAMVGMSKSTLYKLLPELHEKGVAVKIADHSYLVNRRGFLRYVGEDVA